MSKGVPSLLLHQQDQNFVSSAQMHNLERDCSLFFTILWESHLTLFQKYWRVIRASSEASISLVSTTFGVVEMGKVFYTQVKHVKHFIFRTRTPVWLFSGPLGLLLTSWTTQSCLPFRGFVFSLGFLLKLTSFLSCSSQTTVVMHFLVRCHSMAPVCELVLVLIHLWGQVMLSFLFGEEL